MGQEGRAPSPRPDLAPPSTRVRPPVRGRSPGLAWGALLFPPAPCARGSSPRTAGFPAPEHSQVSRPAPRTRSLATQERTATSPDAARPGAGRSRGLRAVGASRLRRPDPSSASSAPGDPLRLRSLRRAPARGPPTPLRATRYRRAAPHSPAPHGRSTAPSSRTPSSAIVTPQFRPAMAPGRLGLGGGEPAVASGSERRPRAPEPDTGCAALRPGELTCVQERGPGLRPASGSRSWPGLSPPLSPPPLPASAPAPPSQGAGTCRRFPVLVFPLRAEGDQTFLSTGSKVALGEADQLSLPCPVNKKALVSPVLQGNHICGSPKP